MGWNRGGGNNGGGWESVRERLRHLGPCLKTRAGALAGQRAVTIEAGRPLFSTPPSCTPLPRPRDSRQPHIFCTLCPSAAGISHPWSHVSQQSYEDRVWVAVSILQMRKLRHWEVRVTMLVETEPGFKPQQLQTFRRKAFFPAQATLGLPSNMVSFP